MKNLSFTRGIIVARVLAAIAFAAIAFAPAGVVQAHAKGENYVWINVEEDHINGRFEVGREDLKLKLGIDVDALGSTRLEGARESQATVQKYLESHFSIVDSSGELKLEFNDATLFNDGNRFIQYPYRINGLPENNQITVRNRIFLTPDLIAKDRLHRSVIVVEYNKVAGQEFGEENVALVFSPGKTELAIDLADPPTVLVWRDFLKQGLLHIAIGLDHVVFIVLILLTVVLRADGDRWVGQAGFGAVFWKSLKVITAFTVAHSVTLSLAALGLVSVNMAAVETVIALSILVVALTNLLPSLSTHSLLLIFIFGLFHGLGFASVMGDLQFRTVLMERILLLFNIGVEIGQIIIAIVVLPILYVLRNRPWYRRYIVVPISLVSGCLAIFWIMQRTGLIE